MVINYIPIVVINIHYTPNLLTAATKLITTIINTHTAAIPSLASQLPVIAIHTHIFIKLAAPSPFIASIPLVLPGCIIILEHRLLRALVRFNRCSILVIIIVGSLIQG